MFRKLMRGKYQPLVVLFFMAVAGVTTASVGKIALGIGLWLFGYGLYKTVIKRNRNGEAHLFSAMIVGGEVYFRMSHAGLPWEFGKIAVISLLTIGMLVESQKKIIPYLYFPYALLLIPAAFVPDWQSMEDFKKEIMFNMSGHVSLIVAIVYFYRRKFSMDEFIKFGRWMIYGVFLMAVMILVKSPDYGDIHYGGGSNFSASGGFGPNQVAALFGLGIFIMGVFLILNKRLFNYKLIDMSLLTMFILQGLFTLSRGGLITAGISLFLGVFLLYLFDVKQAMKVLKGNILRVSILTILVVFSFMQANSISGGAVGKRYFNVDAYGKQIKEDYSTHRIGIVEADIATFKDNLITGVGVGGSRDGRLVETGISAVHVEFSRMLADHGILGVLALLILFLFPIKTFFRLKNTQSKFILVTFTAFALLTMSHNAMRLALPGFLYGFGFILLYMSNEVLTPRNKT